MKTNKEYAKLLRGREDSIQIVAYETLKKYGIEDSPVARVLTQTMYESIEEVGESIQVRMDSARIMQHIANSIRECCEPYLGRINDDSAYWSMVTAARNTVSEAMNEGIIAQAGVRVDADTSVVTVEYQPTMSVERMIVSVNLNA